MSFLRKLKVAYRRLVFHAPSIFLSARKRREYKIIRKSGAFDTDFYRINYGREHRRIARHPLLHYVFEGSQRSYDPNGQFSSNFYLSENPDVAARRDNPFAHYLSIGKDEGRPTRRSLPGANKTVLAGFTVAEYDEVARAKLLDEEWYLDRNPDVRAAGQDALLHYMSSGWREGRDPSDVFDTVAYLTLHPDVAASGMVPLLHYARHGRAEARVTNLETTPIMLAGLFDPEFYLRSNPDVAQAGIRPLIHYLTSGWREGRQPHPLFDPLHYRGQMADGFPEEEPVRHYLEIGAALGLDPNPYFDTRWYRTQFPDGLPASINPLSHYVFTPVAERANPGPLFDGAYYRIRYPDVGAAGVDALEHFLQSGTGEGRLPRPADPLMARCAPLEIPFEVLKAPDILPGCEVALFVTFSDHGHIADHVVRHLDALRTAGFVIVLIVVTNGLTRPLRREAWQCEGIIVRQNHGWDFAAWATAMAVFPDFWSAGMALLVNDSVFGPLRPELLDEVVERGRRSAAGIVALTDSFQVRHHLMSYFTIFTATGLRSEATRAFWRNIESLRDKQAVIDRYELIGIDHWRREAVEVEVLFPTPETAGAAINPTLAGWRDLVDRGFPYLKVQLLRDTLDQVDARGWRATLGNNAGLLAEIERHLQRARREGSVAARRVNRARAPNPPPHRRFLRDWSLSNQHGAVPAHRPHPSTDLILQVPFGMTPPADADMRVAVALHIFYVDVLDELISFLSYVPFFTDLYISTDSAEKAVQLEQRLSEFDRGEVVIRICPNRGRDIAPIFVEFGQDIARYALVLHLHSKRSLHNDALAGWREHLLKSLLGSNQIISSIAALLRTGEVGFVTADHFEPIRSLLNWGHNFASARALLRRAGGELSKEWVLDFPSSSFFWARGEALRPLIDQSLRWQDFPDEAGQIDGTTAHAIERSLFFAAEQAGWRWIKVTAERTNRRDGTVLIAHDAADAARQVDRAYRPLTGNPLGAVANGVLVPEYRQIATVASTNTRPRLNLIVPSIEQKHVFGGITTALKVVEDLTSAAQGRFDLRVMTTTAAVTIEAMATRQGYSLVPARLSGDAFARTIVDASGVDTGEIPIRPNDFFVATAWWTAMNAEEFAAAQSRYYGRSLPHVYLVQDDETAFYSESAHRQLAAATYRPANEMIAIINSEELANHFAGRSQWRERASVLRYKTNRRVAGSLKAVPRERIVLVYGRPGVKRNCFETLIEGIFHWQQRDPDATRDWRIVSVGETYPTTLASGIANLEVMGKVTLEEYGDLLSRATVGVSLMASPHPSYPPLEMAEAGMLTITNDFPFKALARRSANVRPISAITPGLLAEQLALTIAEAEDHIGKLVPFGSIAEIDCDLPNFDKNLFVSRLEAIIENKN